MLLYPAGPRLAANPDLTVLERHIEIPEDSRNISKAFLISMEITHFFFLEVFYFWTAKPYLILRE